MYAYFLINSVKTKIDKLYGPCTAPCISSPLSDNIYDMATIGNTKEEEEEEDGNKHVL